MKVIIRTSALMLAMLAVTATMQAHADQDRRGDRDRHADRYHDYRYDYDRERKREQRRHRDDRRLRLFMPARVNGTAKLRLGRMVRHHHGIDIRDYNLKSVVLHNGRAYRKSRARVYVGEHSRRQQLTQGRNRIRAPHGYGRWAVQVKHAHLSGITVIMEPKPRYARYRNDRYRPYPRDYGYWPTR